MRKYNLSTDNSVPENGIPPIRQSVGGSRRNFRGCSGLPSFFDVPCLYYPQFPCNWNGCQRDDAYAIFAISAPDSSETALTLSPMVQEGRGIQLDPEGDSIILLPGKLYLVSYQIQGQVTSSLGVVPAVDGISDLCNASYATGPEAVESRQSVSSTFLLPVVETPSTLQLQLQEGTVLSQGPSGSVSIAALADL